jgi:hypothetical protein
MLSVCCLMWMDVPALHCRCRPTAACSLVQSRAAALRASSLPLDHYGYPNRDNDAARMEAPKGKQMVGGAVDDKSRRAFKDVVHHT